MLQSGKPQKPGSPALPPCSKPVKPAQPAPPVQKPVYCGNTDSFGRTVESYVTGNNAQDMFPWNVIITSKIMGSTKCIGSLVHRGGYQQIANTSDLIITAADCFVKYTPASAKSELLVFANSPRFSRLKRRGIKAEIVDVNLYGLAWGNSETRRGIAILKLERPLSRKDNVVPVCLAERDSVPPPSASCYVTYYDKRDHRMDEEIVMITRKPRCLAASSKVPQYRGVCTMEEKKKEYIQLGSPMVCLVNGRAYQYGVYLNQLSLKINDKVKQNLGFYSEINVAHDVFSGKKVQTLSADLHRQLGVKSYKPIQASSSSSSSASRETHRRRTLVIPDVFIPIPTKLPTISKPEQKRSKSSSSSSSSSSDSSSKHRHISREIKDSSKSAEEADDSTRVIRLNVKVVKTRLAALLRFNKTKRPHHPGSSSSSLGEEIKPYPLPDRPKGPVICPGPGQRPVKPIPDSSSGVLVCPTPNNAVEIVPLPTPLPTAEYPSSSLEAVNMVILPSLPKYDMSDQTIADHEHILVRDNIVGESAIAHGRTASCDIIGTGDSMHSLLPGKSSGEITGNEIDSRIPDVTEALETVPCTRGDSTGHHQYDHLPGASGVHIFMITGSSIEPLCTGTLYARRGQEYSDEVVTASRCIPPKGNINYKVYIGSLLPRKMAVDQLNRTLIDVGSIHESPFYEGYDELKEIGLTMLKLKHRVKVINGVQSFPLPYSVRIQYQLLTPTECKQHLGNKFLPSVMYCGVGQKNILKYPIGSPLLCQSSGNWVQFGIYDHSFPTSRSYAAVQSENEIVPDDVALFVKLEGDNVGRVQNEDSLIEGRNFDVKDRKQGDDEGGNRVAGVLLRKVEHAFYIVTDPVTKKRSQLQVVSGGDLHLLVILVEPNINRLVRSHLGEPSSSR
ncbi:Trypsin domain containing protein [Trichuris trichiura]|uniref:Trypsin domain containing protein n=1 Tax=Trichuris trichiura TaxID=36087 RepID=A0A077ZJV9_TRITR|nr:Trypsin domain containing protein [Trichuris trichiura]